MEADFQAERVAEARHSGFEISGHEGNLAETDHRLRMVLRAFRSLADATPHHPPPLPRNRRGHLGLRAAMKDSRRRLGPVAAGGLVLAVLALGACSLGTSGANAPTSTIPSTAFRTIPVSPPKPTEPTVAAAATTSTPVVVPSRTSTSSPA